MKELLLFQAGNIQFGLNLPLVKSIHSVNARFAEQTGSSHKLVQVMDGEELPLYDLPSILRDQRSSGDPMGQKVILVEAHEHPIALGVDRVEGVVSVNSDRIHPLPLIFTGLSLSCFPRVLKHEDELILLLNPEEIENLEPEISDTETDTPKLESMNSSLEKKETSGPMAQVDSDNNDIPQDNSQKSEIGNGETTSSIPYSESIPSGEIKRDQGEQEQVGSELSAMDASFEEMTPDTEDSDTHDTEEKAAVADVDQTAVETPKESFQLEESILSGEQELVGPGPSAMDVSLEDMTPETEDSIAHDTEEKTAVADVDQTAAETSPDENKVETGVEGGHLETAKEVPDTNSFEEIPGETQYVEGKDEVDEENRLISSIGLSLDSRGESGSPIEEGKPVSGDALSQVAAVQPEEIVSLKEVETAAETPEPESTDYLRSEEEDTAAPLLPAGEVSSLVDLASIESEPISKEPFHDIFSDSSDIITSVSGDRSDKTLSPSELLQELEIDDGKQKGSYRGPFAAGVLALVVLFLLSMWLWPNSTPNVPEVVIKPMPIASTIRGIKEKPEDLSQAPQKLEPENQRLSQTPQPLNTGEKAINKAHPSLNPSAEVFRIDTRNFTLTVERPKNGQPSVSAGMTGKNEHSHIVMKDDTLWQIAKRYLGDPFRYPEIAKLSRISNPDRIYPGDIVRIINKNEKTEGKEGKSS